jgi:hypothetical protein
MPDRELRSWPENYGQWPASEMNAVDLRGDQGGMTANELEQRLADLERRHERTRALLVDALSAAAILLIGFIFRPEGWHAVMLGFAAGFLVPPLITSWFLRDGTPDRAHARRRARAPVAPWRGLDRHSIGNRKAAG